MKIQCQKSDLLNSVNIVLKGCSCKNNYAYIRMFDYRMLMNYGIKLIANDMELGIETMVKGNMMEEGTVALNAKVFSEIVRRLPENEV